MCIMLKNKQRVKGTYGMAKNKKTKGDFFKRELVSQQVRENSSGFTFQIFDNQI